MKLAAASLPALQLPAAVYEGKATLRQLAKNWVGSYLGNALGCALGCLLLLNCGLMVRVLGLGRGLGIAQRRAAAWLHTGDVE